jgi:hypothetical protein
MASIPTSRHLGRVELGYRSNQPQLKSHGMQAMEVSRIPENAFGVKPFLDTVDRLCHGFEIGVAEKVGGIAHEAVEATPR